MRDEENERCCGGQAAQSLEIWAQMLTLPQVPRVSWGHSRSLWASVFPPVQGVSGNAGRAEALHKVSNAVGVVVITTSLELPLEIQREKPEGALGKQAPRGCMGPQLPARGLPGGFPGDVRGPRSHPTQSLGLFF